MEPKSDNRCEICVHYVQTYYKKSIIHTRNFYIEGANSPLIKSNICEDKGRCCLASKHIKCKYSPMNRHPEVDASDWCKEFEKKND